MKKFIEALKEAGIYDHIVETMNSRKKMVGYMQSMEHLLNHFVVFRLNSSEKCMV